MSGLRDRLLDVLRQHADSRGRVDLPATRLPVLLGTNIHEVDKELFNLKEAGLAELRVRTHGSAVHILGIKLKLGALGMAKIASSATEQHSVPERAWSWLTRQPQQPDGWIATTPNRIAAGIGLPAGDNRVSIAISGWARQERISLRKEGGRIVAIRVHKLQVTQRSPEAAAPPPAPRAGIEIPACPELELYRKAKALAGLVPERPNPYLTVEFTSSAIAEEGLALLRLIEQIAGQEK